MGASARIGGIWEDGAHPAPVPLPFAAEPGKAKATFQNGVRSITLPKPPAIAAEARRIAINPGQVTAPRPAVGRERSGRGPAPPDQQCGRSSSSSFSSLASRLKSP